MHPQRFVSLLDMLKYEAHSVLPALTYVPSTMSEWRLHAQIVQSGVVNPSSLPIEERSMFVRVIKCLRDSAIQLEMVAAVSAGRDAFDFYQRELASSAPFSAHKLGTLFPPGDRLLHAYIAEAGSRQFYVVDGKHAKFYTDTESLFGDQVESAFPSSAPEISEAGKCRVLGRWTACVMHLMRALEPPLLTLQAAVAVSVPKEQWDQIINQVEAEIREIRKATHGNADEQWYSEAASHFRIVKNAWRNHSQHLHERYDEERAVVVYDSVRAFMRHLATRLSE